jgi:spore photoproduct lyase
LQAFNPDLVFFEPRALEYPLGQKLFTTFKRMGVPIKMTTSHNRVTGIPGDSETERYRNAKRTLVVGIRKTLDFDSSKPSAEYAIPLTTGCAGHCHYCYLQTTMSTKPYVRVYVNLDEILERAKQYIEERKPEITRFEAACTGDPVSLEHLTGALKKYIEFMSEQSYGRLRFVTKFANVQSLLDVPHGGNTTVRFSVNSDYVIKHFEPATSTLPERIEAAKQIASANYPFGFIVAPIIIYNGWQEGYENLFRLLYEKLGSFREKPFTFELIQHRFTLTAKKTILRRYPRTRLEMNEENRKRKWGRYGKFKYVYPDESANELKQFFMQKIEKYFPNAQMSYFV